MTVRFFWDFFGPDAERTAAHFATHLREFLERHALVLPVMTSQEAEGHWFTSCDPPDVPSALSDDETTTEPVADRIGKALRPQRVEILEDL